MDAREKPPTPIEEWLRKQKDRFNRRLHDLAFDASKKRGADFRCATLAGFAATDHPPTKPEPRPACARGEVGR